MRSTALCILMFAAMPLLAQLRGSVQYNADTDPALQESWRLLRQTKNATQGGLAPAAGNSMLKRWQSVYRALLDLWRHLGRDTSSFLSRIVREHQIAFTANAAIDATCGSRCARGDATMIRVRRYSTWSCTIWSGIGWWW